MLKAVVEAVSARSSGGEKHDKSPKKSLDNLRNLLYYSDVLRQDCAAGMPRVRRHMNKGFILDSYSLEDQQATPSGDTF